MKTAIVLSGHTMALGVVRALGSMGVPVIIVHYDEKDTGQYSKYIQASFKAPHPEKNEAEFINVLLQCANEYSDGVIFPVSDETVVAVARNKDTLSKYFKIACPELDIVNKYIDKKYTYALADSNGVAAPKTITPQSIKDVEDYAKQVDFPCLVKPCQSHLFYDYFKCKMFPVNNAVDMLSIYKQARDAGLEVMLQEIIPGDDDTVVNYNAYFWDGEPLVEFTAEHVRNAPPWWGSPRVALSNKIPEVIEPGRKILKAMGFYGYACTEFKKDTRDGLYKLMEVNGRHNLSTLLSVRCGINFPWIQYKHLVSNELPTAKSFKSGIYWIDITRDVGYSLKFLKEEGYSLKQYLRPYLNQHVYAIFDLSDIKPFVRRCLFLFKQGLYACFAYLKPVKKNSTRAVVDENAR